MNSVSKRACMLLAICLFAFTSLFAQAEPNQPFPDQVVSAGIDFNQSAAPQIQGFVAYSKLLSAANGTYSYTKITESGVNLKPLFAIQTQTETGVCNFVSKFGKFDLFGCVQAGLATAGGNTGVSAGGDVLAVKPLKNGWSFGLDGGPSYSQAAKAVGYHIGTVLSWGK